MISAAIRAKPWVHMPDGYSEQSEQSRLLTALLERGFPVQLGVRRQESSPVSRVEHDESGDTPIDPIVLYRGQTAQSDSVSREGGPSIDISDLNADQILNLIDGLAAGTEGAPSRPWKPWFPVIDYNRCTNCMQCLSFCLFNVYNVTSDGKITVQNENNCKTDCPACSRVCPEVAIMFPKYKAGPINGDVVNSDDVRREGMKVDISALLGGDIYSMLRDRSTRAKSRFSAERDDDRALKERQRCLDKLKTIMTDLDIPAEVLASLPSRDQIESKAKEAQQRAQDALENNAQNQTLAQ